MTPTGTPAGTGRRPDPAASMSLITELTEHPLDPAYRWEAERRVAAGRAPNDSLRNPWLLLVAFAVGLALAVSAASQLAEQAVAADPGNVGAQLTIGNKLTFRVELLEKSTVKLKRKVVRFKRKPSNR